MQVNSIWKLGFILNLFFLYSVFQIYFQSPVVEIHETYHRSTDAKENQPFSRLVFIVCDGLRADTFYRNPKNHPYLTSLLHAENSVWGISDTRVPTESRPGHIALFAGIYEDPSAIFTGWKKNFVEFDSVFNRSKYSIALGSPDIVDMFAEGAGRGKVHVESYPATWQDFLKSNSYKLDTWVLDRFKTLAVKNRLPIHDQLLIFLHLLGVDNTGHVDKPNSGQYLESVANVDGIVPQVEEIVKEVYQNDNLTLFVFTSDHGMTDWGSHGAGSTDETETPFVIWGDGIKSSSRQLRLKQADFSALVAGALGIAFPTNSIGRFPTEIWKDSEFAYSALRANFKQMRALMFGKKAIIDRGIIPLVPFSNENEIQKRFSDSVRLAKNRDYAEAIKALEEGIDILMQGIVYYERYDQRLMTFLTIYTFIIWILILCVTIFSPGNSNIKFLSRHNILDICISGFVTLVFLDWPFLRIPYTFVPIYLTRLLFSVAFSRNSKIVGSKRELSLKDCILGGLVAVIGAEILVMTFYQREIVSLGLIVNAAWCLQGKQLPTKQKFLWILSTLLLAIFPTIPIIGLAKNTWFLSLGSLICVIVSVFWLRRYSTIATTMSSPEPRDKVFLYVQIFQMFMSGILVHFPEFILTRILAWLSLPSMFFLPAILSSQIFFVQFLSIFLAISNPFIYLTLNYEVFFMPTLFITLLILLKMEIGNHQNSRTISWQDFMFFRVRILEEKPETNIVESFRLACLHLCFVYLSFFGIGNIASISSFDPSAAGCFVSVFSPFVMMALLLVKILGPFLLVACTFRLLVTSWKEVEVNFTIVLCLCQVMALHMFLNVTNVGSWLEIGTSISHFVIVQVTTLFLFLLFFIANFLVGNEMVSSLTRSKLL